MAGTPAPLWWNALARVAEDGVGVGGEDAAVGQEEAASVQSDVRRLKGQSQLRYADLEVAFPKSRRVLATAWRLRGGQAIPLTPAAP
jgi:hypothetical protein